MELSAGHLTYCTNIHAGESWDAHFESLKKNFPLIKAHVSKDMPMGIGLRLSNIASIDLQDSSKLQEFKLWLQDHSAYVFTMNGFPYGDFHHAVVKDKVHAPDWCTTERLDYTLRLFDTLSKLLPEGLSGGISTSPLTYRHWHPSKEQWEKAMIASTLNIVSVLRELILIKRNKNISMHLDIEPEPDGMLETGREFIDWYQGVFLPMAVEDLKVSLNISAENVIAAAKEHICLCYDVCHFAIGYEPHRQVIDELVESGIAVGKIQISAALKARLPDDVESRNLIATEFSRFNEPTYLHQVVAKKEDNSVIRYRDLPAALEDIQNPEVAEWRAHFHVPVFVNEMGLLNSTQSDIVEVLNIQKSSAFTSHLEVETYTWEVLPESLKASIDQSISRELNWVRGVLGD
ncbi:metabolite traffic protein EboE [Daejeonella sp. JGW-45]|uniref:metabolite traffic protein EboE n=1 Tax=Daejeonella sp. JGW-45 TaxID=3034148 RepID=UPI0023EBEABD|nr:metabolite traffic protein EboE [Daejeonella sp. JGW-45]